MKQLILGGARSGKSSLAESLAQSNANNNAQSVLYIATSNSALNDTEMDRRIELHRSSRPPEWQTIESPIALAETLQQQATDNHCLLVDCLTLWLSNCLMDNCWQQERQALLDLLPSLPGSIIFVSNEVGHGIVPLGELNRQFVDESGFLHQALAPICDRVIFTIAGLPTVLKGDPLGTCESRGNSL